VENKYENIDEVIARVLSDEASPDDIQIVNAWIASSPENEKEFESSKKLFEQGSVLKNLISVDTDKAWLNVKSRINREESRDKETGRVISIQKSPGWNYALRIAAMLVVVAGLGAAVFLMMNKNKTVDDILIASTDKIKQDTLPDGSIFTLNRKSAISFSSDEYGRKRIVHLKGEAFFEVKHNEANEFIVEAGGLEIKDVGTSFNVKAIPDSRIVFVVVESGEVKILTDKEDSLHLFAGETAEYNIDTKQLVKGINDDKNLSAYRDKIFIFDNTELKVIVKLLNDVYGSNIVVDNKDAGNCRLTASFNNETLDSIIDIISETLHLQVEKNDTEILLKGNACR
jgi:transmembrane sensor